MNLNRLIVVLVMLITGIFFAATESFAGKPGKCSPWPECKDDGGDPPPPPPPTGCTDTFPGFLYEVKGTRKLPAELRLASTKGCRTEQVATSTHLEWSAFHMTSDGSKGVVVWSEDPESNFKSIVRRRNFTVDGFGNLILEPPVTILPLAGEEAPGSQRLGYGSLDVWGDATHGLLFMVLKRNYDADPEFSPGSGITETLIYDLNALTNVNASPGVRVIYYENFVDWGGYTDWRGVEEPECNDSSLVPFPRFVPSCYRPEELRFNSSGTRIYFSSKLFLKDGRREYAEMRINIDWLDSSDPADWEITGPEMVYVNGPRDARPRPPSPLPSPEIVMADGQFLNADQCAGEYATYTDGNSEPLVPIWQLCSDNNLLATDGKAESWDSPDSYLFYRGEKRRDDIYRFYVSGDMAGSEEKLINSGQSPDAGF